MYSERNRQPSTRRSDDAFLRRMLGGELTPNGGTVEEPRFSAEQRPERPLCDGSYPNGGAGADGGCGDCPKHGGMPSLAMVYAPRQCFQNLLEPASGLHRGSLFAELVMPFEGDTIGKKSCNGGEVRLCK